MSVGVGSARLKTAELSPTGMDEDRKSLLKESGEFENIIKRMKTRSPSPFGEI